MPADPRIVKVLARNPTFSRIAERDLEVLSGLGQLRHLIARKVIFEKGSEPTEFFALLEGGARVSSPGRRDKQLFVRELVPGDVFGELGVLDQEPRSATVTTTEVSTLAAFDARDFREYLVRTPQASLELLRVLSFRVRDTTRRLEDQVFLKIEERLAKVLLDLARREGVETDEGTAIGRAVTQRELAEMVGANREGINRQITAWEGKGLIRRSDDRIVLCDVSGLESIAPGESG